MSLEHMKLMVVQHLDLQHEEIERQLAEAIRVHLTGEDFARQLATEVASACQQLIKSAVAEVVTYGPAHAAIRERLAKAMADAFAPQKAQP